MKKTRLYACAALLLCSATGINADVVIDMASAYGIRPDRKENVSPKVQRALTDIKNRHRGEKVTLQFAPGRYDFHPRGSIQREYYISNHDQPNPKSVGIAIEDWDNVSISAPGADFVFHGRMLPLAVVESENCTLDGFSIDFANPHITQVEITANSETEGITFRTAPWVKSTINKKGAFVASGEGWELSPNTGIAFDPATRHLIYRTSDLWCPLDSVVRVSGKDLYRAPKWKDSRLPAGTIVALRTWDRPAPGIFLSDNRSTVIKGVKVHYAEGMGLLAQLCDGITLEGFGVCQRGDNDPRYFTTQADATHFSGCKGVIRSSRGLYEGMMDDAINVHGTYLKVTGRPDANTLTARYMHAQSYGFKWGEPGDTVRVISSRTMENVPGEYVIESISPVGQASVAGCKDFQIRFTSALPEEVSGSEPFGLENLTWSPEVYFTYNIIRNNRARGSLFSTPRHTVVEDNLFDHTSGTAVLLCGDCMGWFETGACHDVAIRRNRFVNSLTNMFQFTEAIISIYPEIHDLQSQQQYFHSGITIEDNEFVTFDSPLLYAKSVDGLLFKGNRVRHTTDFKPFHKNRFNFRFQRARNVTIEKNDFGGISPSVSFE